MTQLPFNNSLSISKLSSIFNDTTNSYKFFWFLAILESLKEGKNEEISLESLTAKMLSLVWFPINYYRLSFGKQDQFSNKVRDLKLQFGFSQNMKKEELEKQILNFSSQKEVQEVFKLLTKYVPFRFLRPFFTENLRGIIDNQVNDLIVQLAEKNFINSLNPILYKFSIDKKSIIMNPLWLNYLETHLGILEAFCKYHLILYLQKNNPNTPNVADKLEPETERDLKNAKIFWKTYLTENQNFNCIYSTQLVSSQNLSIDHFLPFSFVAHDQIWNLLPTTKNVNSSKSDNIPDLQLYFKLFLNIQYQAFKVNFEKKHLKILEDYSNIFNSDLENIYAMNLHDFSEKMQQTILPLVQIASNMGFQKNWTFKNFRQ
jgi:hypothetical protein